MKGYKHLTDGQRAEILAIYAETKSTRLTAERTGYKFRNVQHTLKAAGVELTNRRLGRCDRNRDEVIRMVAAGATLVDIARKIGSGRTRIRQWLEREGLPVPTLDFSGDRNPNWKGGKTIDKHGYVLMLAPDHPDADSHGRVREHRLVMEKMLGRRLDPSEVVHHKDDNPGNNEPSNLEIYGSNSDHLRETLVGQRPEWTEEGRARMRAGIARSANRRRTSNRPALEPDDIALPETTDHPQS